MKGASDMASGISPPSDDRSRSIVGENLTRKALN